MSETNREFRARLARLHRDPTLLITEPAAAKPEPDIDVLCRVAGPKRAVLFENGKLTIIDWTSEDAR